MNATGHAGQTGYLYQHTPFSFYFIVYLIAVAALKTAPPQEEVFENGEKIEGVISP